MLRREFTTLVRGLGPDSTFWLTVREDPPPAQGETAVQGVIDLM